jgi:hypothetical protein
MKLKSSHANSYKKPDRHTIPTTKRVHPMNAKVIHLAEHKLKRKHHVPQMQKNRLVAQRNKLKPQMPKYFSSKIISMLRNDRFAKLLFLSAIFIFALFLLSFLWKNIAI